MKVHEALEMLSAMNPNAEVTVTMGSKRKTPNYNGPGFNQAPYPSWVEVTPMWPKSNNITCTKVH
jgi:hypothetical protein